MIPKSNIATLSVGEVTLLSSTKYIPVGSSRSLTSKKTWSLITRKLNGCLPLLRKRGSITG